MSNLSNYTFISGNTATFTGNVTGDYIIGNGSQLTGLPAGYSNSDVANYLPTYSGNLESVDTVNAATFIGEGGNIGNIQGANVTGQVANALVAGTVYTAAQPNITSVGTLSTLEVTGNVSANYFIGNGSQLTDLPVAAIIANGNSNVSIASADGPVLMFDGGDRVASISTERVAIGDNAGITAQNIFTVAVGYEAGQDTQGIRAVAVGYQAGADTQGANAIAIGATAAATAQGDNSIAVGSGAGYDNQGNIAIAIGLNSGVTAQGALAIAIGGGAGLNTQGSSAVAIGPDSGSDTQGENAIAIGSIAGSSTQGANAIAIGVNSAGTAQGENAIAIGQSSGQANQGTNSVAIGAFAGETDQPVNSIIINASGSTLDGTESGLYINPVRNDTGNTTNVVYYNDTTKEVTYGPGTTSYGNTEVAAYLPTYTGNLGNVNSLGTTGNIDTLGDINVSLGNITVGGGVSAATFTGDGGALSNITAANITGQVANALVAGTVYTNAQPNITSVGTLTSLTTIGDVGVTGNITATGNIYGSYLIGDGSKLTGIAPTVQVYEFANIASGVNGYFTSQWLGDYVPGTITTITTTIGTTPTLIGSFITDVGYPGIPTLPIGTNTVSFETQKASGTKFYTCYAEFYKRTTGGTETLINTSDITTAFNLNTKIQQVVSDFIASPITLDVTDRIVIKLYASTTSGTDSITLSFDDNTNSGLQLSVLPASISNFVPYVGSTANLNLGTYSFTTTGNVTGAHIIGEGGNLSNIQGGNVTGAVAFASSANSVAGANVSGTVGSATTAGTVTANAQPNITSVGTLSTLEVTGNVLFGNANIGNLVVTGTTTTANVSDLDVANATIIISSGANALVSNGAGLFVGSESPTVGSLTYLYSSNSWNSSLLFQAPDFTTTGNVTGGSIIGEGGNLSNISGANVTGEVAFAAVANSVDGGNVVGGVFQAFNATRASIANSVSGSNVTGTVGNATYAQIVIAANQPNITQLGTLLDLTVEGAINLGDAANITITGGTAGQVLTSGGTGAASWTTYGDSNIAAYLASGNDTTGFLTSGDVVANNLVADGGLSAFGEALYYANVTINADANVTGNLLATSVVAATIGNASSVLFGDGSNIAGLSTYTDTDVSLYLASGIDANGYTTTGNITGNFFIGNGSQLTGLPSVTPTTIVNGTSNVSVATTDGNITLTVGGAAVGTISQNSLVYGQLAGAGVGANSIALGYATASITQGIKSVAIGYNAGSNTQGQESVAIGSQAGSNTQGVAAVAVGIEAGLRTQGGTAVAIGAFAGQQGQGANSIAIGSRAGTLNQPANTIIINATGAVFNAVAAQANSFYVNPIRNDTGNTTNVVYYNTTTKEVTYGPDAYGNTQVAAYLPTYTGNLGNVANIAATGNITANGNIIVNGTVGTGNISGANNISGINLLASNAITVGATVTVLPNSVATFGSNANSYTQITFQNLSNGADATSDIVLTTDNGSDTVNFADFGIINSAYDPNTPTNSLGNVVFASDAYLYAQGNTGNTAQSGGNLVLGATVSTKNVKIFAGGNSNSFVTATFTSTAANLKALIVQGTSNLGAVANVTITGGTSGQVLTTNGSNVLSWTTASVPSIANGTSNVRIATSGGNISFNLNGSAAGFITNEFPLKSSVALGVGAGTLGNGSIAIGYTAGSLNQGYTAIAIGPEAGRDNQGVTAISIGTQAGLSTQGDQGIAIGVLAGSSGQGINAVALGTRAGKTNQSANSIIINATGADLNGANSGLYVAPVRSANAGGGMLAYNSTTKEVIVGIPQLPAFANLTAISSAVTSPVAGMMAYDTANNRPAFYNGTSWTDL
jgi:hypothetical protein